MNTTNITTMPNLHPLIQSALEEFEKKFYPSAIFSGDDIVQKIALQKELEEYHEKLKAFLSSKLLEIRNATIEEVVETIDEYFRGLIMMPYPQASKEQLIAAIRKGDYKSPLSSLQVKTE